MIWLLGNGLTFMLVLGHSVIFLVNLLIVLTDYNVLSSKLIILLLSNPIALLIAVKAGP